MHFRVGIERKPITDKRKPVGEVEGPKTRAGVVAAIFAVAAGGSEAEKALQEGVNSDRSVALAPPDRGSLEAEFEVLRWTEANLFERSEERRVGKECRS